MSDINYGFGKQVDLSFEQAIQRVTEELQKVGFGVLTTIDVSETLKKKLNKDMPRYQILGACNPNFAHQALDKEPTIGLLLPCNVVVRQDESAKVHIEFMNPLTVLELVNNTDIKHIASEVYSQLMLVYNSL